uniref:MATH domain-containing protein n=1 Tax=Panagrellus redivivus TaxID=6233 RepID=A0A7E4VAL2_PANRE
MQFCCEEISFIVQQNRCNFNITKDRQQATLLFLTHDELKAASLPENIEFKVFGIFRWTDTVNTESLPPGFQSSSSCQIELIRSEINGAMIGVCRSTSKVDVPSIPGLQWWLDYYPNGNSGMQAKTVMIFLRVSMAPVNVELTYSIDNAEKTVFSGRKTEKVTRHDALRDIVQLKHHNPKFKDELNNGALTFVCVSSFTVPTEKVVPRLPSVAFKPITDSISALNSQEPSCSTSIGQPKTDEPLETTVPPNPPSRLSAQIVLTEVDLSDELNNGALTFVCVSSFTVPTEKVVPRLPSVASKPITDLISALNSQEPSCSTSIGQPKTDEPLETTVPPNPPSRLSAQIVLTEVDLSSMMGRCISTSKSDVPNIPGLQWWLDCYPNGDSGLQAKTVMIFLRVSAAPVTVEVKYLVKNTDIENTKTLTFTRLETKFCVVQLRNDSPIFKSGFVDGVITFMFFPSFSHVHQSPSNSAPVFIPKTVTDSCTLPLYATEFFAANIGKLKSTPKRSFPDVPGLQWWLECYPAGNTPKDPIRRMVAFLRASVTPITMTVTYHVPGTSIYRQLTDTIRSESSQGFSHSVIHDKIFAEDVFKAGFINLKCDVTITVPETLIRQQIVSSFVAELMSPVPTTLPASKVSDIASQPTISTTVPTPSLSAVKTPSVKPKITVTDSTFIVLNDKIDLHPRNALKPITTPKRRINEIKNLEWWLEIFPAGNSIKQTKTFIAFVCVSKAPVLIDAVYSFAGTDIKRQIQFKFTSAGARGANVTTSHATLFAANAFTNGYATFKCAVTFNPPQDQQSLVTTTVKPELPNASTVPLKEKRPVMTTVPSSSKVSVELEGAQDRTPPESSNDQPRVLNMSKFCTNSNNLANPNHTSRDSTESDSYESTGDDEEDLESGMTDEELLLHRLKIQEDETNKVLELLKRGSPVLIADGADFL